jgi:hypothetical protein
MTGKELQEAVNKLCLDMKANLPGFIFCGILNCADATIIGSSSASPEISTIANEVSPFFSTIVEQVKKVVTSSESLGVKETHSILIETDKVTNVIGVSNSGKYFILLALDRAKANIAIARTLVERSRSLAGVLDEHL